MTEHPESRSRWTDIFVRRPVVSVVLSLALLLIGVQAAITLPVIQYPVIESTSLEINTFYPGSSAETVRGFITEPIERVASSIPGVNYVESTTTAGRSLVKVWLKLNEDSTDALAELNTRLSQIRFELPTGAEDPAIEIVRADSPYASFYLAMSIPEGETSSSITDLLQRDVLPRMTSLPNVQNAINSGIRPAMRIWVDTARMAALDISARDIQDALYQNNVISTLGRSQNNLQRINLVTNTEAKTPEDFANILLRAEGSVDIRLGDIAEVVAGSEEQTQLSRHSMLDVVFIGIYPAPGANEIAVADALYAEVDAINMVPEAYRNLDRFEARTQIIADITAEGLAVMTTVTRADKETGEDITETVPYVENKPIMQPFGDRSGVVIEPMLTDQWFVETTKIVGPALQAVREGRTKIIPESGEKVYYHWLENIEPWCISRQLWWGHQIPVWFDANGNQYCAASEAEAQAQAGVGVKLTRDPDVLDTWFSSGLWPIGTLGWPDQTDALEKYFPTDVLITGQDILFFWVARMMMMQQAVVDKDPFHTVYLHQLVRDEKGHKMSKTKGNVIDPLEIVDEFGADALRFTMTQMAAIGGVLKLSVDRIKGYRNFGTKLWNAARFAEMNHAFGGDGRIPAAQATVNRWIIGETAKVREEVDAALAAYRFNDAANALYVFVWGKVCDWYVEFSKPLLSGEDAATKAETQATMAWVIDQCLLMLHPIMPFITEELWGSSGARDKMLVHGDWPTYGAELIDAEADREMNWVIGLIDDIRSARQQMHVPAGLKIPMLVSGWDDAGKGAWARNEALIKKLARVESLNEVNAFPKGCISIAVAGGSFALPLADIIDVGAEKARLEKTLQKLTKELGGLRGRLKNPKFVDSAPAEVVAETRTNLVEREGEETALNAALARLNELG